MKIHIEPRLILLARPSIVERGVDELLLEYSLSPGGWARLPADVHDGDSLPELMGRLCYGSFGPKQGRVGAAAYIENILSSGHGSVLEHANFSFVLCRGSRALGQQVTRHRAGWAYSAESTHFIRYGEGGVEPGLVLTGIPPEQRQDAAEAMTRAVEAYADAFAKVEAAFPAEPDGRVTKRSKRKKAVCAAVRNLLPLGLESRLGFTANARALRHFCELRGADDNVPEIRMVAAQLAAIMRAEAPATFADVSTGEGEDGFPVVTTKYRKV